MPESMRVQGLGECQEAQERVMRLYHRVVPGTVTALGFVEPPDDTAHRLLVGGPVRSPTDEPAQTAAIRPGRVGPQHCPR